MNYRQGVTFIELLVVVAIIGLISAISLVNTGVLSANSKVTAATNTIYDTMKKARHDSIAVKEFNGNLFPSYGVEFNATDPANTKIIVYADCLIDDVDDDLIDDNDEFWNNPGVDTCAGGDTVEEITLPYDTKIKEIRSISPAFPFAMPAIAARNQTETEVYMEFVRPEPTIWITLGSTGPLLEAGQIEIDVTDAGEKVTKTVIFYSTGQFAIK